MIRLATAAVIAGGILATSVSTASAETLTLESRIDGLAYYDPNLNITWLTDANAGAGSIYDDGSSPTDGRMSWDSAREWADNLTISGFSNWRLPTTGPINGVSFSDIVEISLNGTLDTGYNISAPGTTYAGSIASEMAYMYYNTLSNIAGSNGLQNTGPFVNLLFDGSDPLKPYAYWSDTEFDATRAWNFNFDIGFQDAVGKTTARGNYAWAVADGDVFVPPVPLPAGIWLLLSALGFFGFLGWRRKRLAAA